jgi:type IV pilus assembly protein PilE
MPKTQSGFTLIEVMIAVVIVAVLATIAYPSYVNQILRTNRSTAKGDVMELQQWMERNYSLTNSYAILPNGTAVSIASLPFQTSPRAGTPVNYQVAFSSGPTATTYTFSAAPRGQQVGDTTCGTLTLSNAGVRGANGLTGNVASVNDCWSR